MLITIFVGMVLLIPARKSLVGGSPEKVRFKEVAKHTLTFSFFFIMVSLVLSVDTLVVKAVVRPAAMAGYYTGAMNFGKTSYYLLQAFAVIILPVVSGLLSQGERGQALSKAQELVLVACAVILPLAIVISSTSEDLLATFYHPEFTVAAPALTFLALSSFCMGMTVIFNMVLNIRKGSRFSDLLSIVSLIVVIPLFIVVAKYSGITALAAASLCCTAVTMVISYMEIKRRFGDPLTRQTWCVLAINAGLWIVLHALMRVLVIDNLVILALIYAGSYGLYLLLLLKTGLLRLRALSGFGRS
jgi:O-antigen/teichoic acid export membrane protein